MFIAVIPKHQPPELCPQIPTRDTHFYRYRLQGQFLPYKPPRPSFCDLHPEAVAFYEEWIEYRREVKVERETAWYTWLTFGMMQRTITKIIIHETHWRVDHYCNGSSSEEYVVQERSYVDDERTGFAYVWDTLIGDDPDRRVAPRTSNSLEESNGMNIDASQPGSKPSPVTNPTGEIIDDDYIEKLKGSSEDDASPEFSDKETSGDAPRFFKEDIIVRENLAGEGYVRVIGTAKHKAEPITLTKGSTVDGDELPHEFLDVGGIADGRYVVEYVGTKPAPQYGQDVIILTISIRETY